MYARFVGANFLSINLVELEERIHLLLLVLGLVPPRGVVLLGHEVFHRRFLGLGLERIGSLLLERVAN